MPSSRRNSIACSLTRWRSEQRLQPVPASPSTRDSQASETRHKYRSRSPTVEATLTNIALSSSEVLADSLPPFIWCGAFDRDARQAAGPSHVSLTREQTSSYRHHGQSQRARRSAMFAVAHTEPLNQFNVLVSSTWPEATHMLFANKVSVLDACTISSKSLRHSVRRPHYLVPGRRQHGGLA